MSWSIETIVKHVRVGETLCVFQLDGSVYPDEEKIGECGFMYGGIVAAPSKSYVIVYRTKNTFAIHEKHLGGRNDFEDVDELFVTRFLRSYVNDFEE
jgi:hypothetical protein